MKAMILAAGRGKRLRPLTDGCPKPLIKVGDKPLIVYHLEALSKAGIKEIVINVSHLGDQIIKTLGNGQNWGVSIEYSIEEQALETGGGIAKARPLLGEAPFILVSGDIYTDYAFKQLPTQVERAHLVLVSNPSYHPQGDFCLKQETVTRKEPNEPSLTYANLAVLNPSLFDACQSEAFPLGALLHHALYFGGVTGEHYQGFWVNVGTVEDLQFLEKHRKVAVGIAHTL